MVSVTPSTQNSMVEHALGALFTRYELSGTAERALFVHLFQQLERHAPLFGCADHPDLDTEQLERVRELHYAELANYTRAGERRALEELAVRSFLSALRDSRELRTSAQPAPPPAPPSSTITTALWATARASSPSSAGHCSMAASSRSPAP